MNSYQKVISPVMFIHGANGVSQLGITEILSVLEFEERVAAVSRHIDLIIKSH